MEWLIDLIKEWVGNQGFLTTGFVNRGDPGAVDFLTVNFTADGTWYELDLSGIVPAGAKAVAVKIKYIHLLIAKSAFFRRLGNVNSWNLTEISTVVAGAAHSDDIIFAVDEDRKAEYNLNVGPWLVFDFTVKGWWL